MHPVCSRFKPTKYICFVYISCFLENGRHLLERQSKGISIKHCTIKKHENDPIHGLKELLELLASIVEFKSIDLHNKRQFLLALLLSVIILQTKDKEVEETANTSLFLVKATLHLCKVDKLKRTKRLHSNMYSEFEEQLE